MWIKATTVLTLMSMSALFLYVNANPTERPATVDICPRACFCYPDPQRRPPHIVVKCHQLADISEVYPPLTSSLILDGNPMRQLTATFLQDKRLEYLESFNCVNCQLKYVDFNAFRGFNSLQVIDLSKNDIAGLTTEHFAGLESLAVLDLAGNERVDCVTLTKGLPKVTVKCTRVMALNFKGEVATDSGKLADAGQLTSLGLKGQNAADRYMTSTSLKGQQVVDDKMAPSGLQGQERDNDEMASLGLKGKDTFDTEMTRRRRQADGEAVTLMADVGASTLPAEVKEECISYAWKVVAIVFIVLWSISCVCNLMKVCCNLCRVKKIKTQGSDGNRAIYQLTTTEVDDRFT